MVSFIEIIKKLMGDKYHTGTGYPGAKEDMKEFVKKVLGRVPELRGKEDWEVESTALEAVDWARDSICKKLKYAEVEAATPDYYEYVAVYSCSHPEIGQFYLAISEDEDAAGGSAHLAFTLTRDRKEALKEYNDTLKEWRNRGIRFTEW